MATNKDIINDFVRGGDKQKVGNLSIKEKGKGTALYSYATPIAYRNKTGTIYATDKKFSQSTTTQQNILKNSTFVKVEKNDKFKKRLDKEKIFDTGRL